MVNPNSLADIFYNIKKKEELYSKYNFEYKTAQDMPIISPKDDERRTWLLKRYLNLCKWAEIERLEANILLLKYNLKYGI